MLAPFETIFSPKRIIGASMCSTADNFSIPVIVQSISNIIADLREFQSTILSYSLFANRKLVSLSSRDSSLDKYQYIVSPFTCSEYEFLCVMDTSSTEIPALLLHLKGKSDNVRTYFSSCEVTYSSLNYNSLFCISIVQIGDFNLPLFSCADLQIFTSGFNDD